MAHWVKDLVLSLQRSGLMLWLRFDLWLRNFHTLWAKKKKKKKKRLAKKGKNSEEKIRWQKGFCECNTAMK